jgi:hypothetical protein
LAIHAAFPALHRIRRAPGNAHAYSPIHGNGTRSVARSARRNTMNTRTSKQRILGLAVAAVMTGVLLNAIDGYAKHGSLGAGSAADVVQLETVTVTASRSGDAPSTVTAAAAAAPVTAPL